MAKALKRMMVAHYEQRLEGLDGVVVVDPGPMTVETVRAFRKDLAEKAGGARMHLLHNRTAKRALGAGLFQQRPEALDEILKGPSAIVYGGDGPIPIAKVLREWRRKHKTLKLKGAVAEGDVFDAADAESLADMPDTPQLRAMILGALLGAPRGIATSLQATYAGIARAIKARIDKSAEGGAG